MSIVPEAQIFYVDIAQIRRREGVCHDSFCDSVMDYFFVVILVF